MKLIAFVMVVFNRTNMEQKQIYETYLQHFDVIDAAMCLNGDCLAVCVSAASDDDRPADFVDFKCSKKHLLHIVDRDDDVELLLDRMYNIVEMFNEQ
ncbi:ac117-like protein [Peridroma alphabaculovirus]|uniref:Ac117-like protein n=1 Tax=Peridroma alphabaculovirus TaxID=1346829 RepID=A0A068LKY4_9ABAC|nr:ac117-like protein [Peridroma alphabaculovirus]AIE47833.1 ac117-like protein [Peridroma alphabaculovirus]